MSQSTFLAAFLEAKKALGAKMAQDAVNTLMREVSLAGGKIEVGLFGERTTVTIRIGDVQVASATDLDCLRATVDAVGQMLDLVKWPGEVS